MCGAPTSVFEPGDILSIAKHKYEVNYSPVDLGAVGPPPPEVTDVDFFGKSLLERAGLKTRKIQATEDVRPEPDEGGSIRHHQR